MESAQQAEVSRDRGGEKSSTVSLEQPRRSCDIAETTERRSSYVARNEKLFSFFRGSGPGFHCKKVTFV